MNTGPIINSLLLVYLKAKANHQDPVRFRGAEKGDLIISHGTPHCVKTNLDSR